MYGDIGTPGLYIGEPGVPEHAYVIHVILGMQKLRC